MPRVLTAEGFFALLQGAAIRRLRIVGVPALIALYEHFERRAGEAQAGAERAKAQAPGSRDEHVLRQTAGRMHGYADRLGSALIHIAQGFPEPGSQGVEALDVRAVIDHLSREGANL